METGLFEIQAEHLRESRQGRKTRPKAHDIIPAGHGQADSFDCVNQAPHGGANGLRNQPGSRPNAVEPATDFARCFLRLANLPTYPLDRLSRYEAILWRQVGQILFSLDALHRRKPQERGHYFRNDDRRVSAVED